MASGAWSNDAIESLVIPSEGGPNRIEINVNNDGAIKIYSAGLLVARIDQNGFTSLDPVLQTAFMNMNTGLFYDFWVPDPTDASLSVLSGTIKDAFTGWGLTVEGEPRAHNVSPDQFARVHAFGNSDTQLATVAFDATQVLTTAGIQYSADNLTAEAFTAFTYAAGPGWADAGGAANPNAQYRLVPVPSNSTQFVGRMTPGATKADNTVIGTINAAHAPITKRGSIPVMVDVVAAGRSPRFDIETNGNVICFGCSAATNVIVNGIFTRDIA